MTVIYQLPLAEWFDLLPIGTSEPPSLSQALAGTRTAGGETIVDRIGTSLWQMQLEMGALTPEEASAAAALIEAGMGPGRYVYATPLQKQYPKSDPGGTVISGLSPIVHDIDRAAGTIDISGLFAGYVLSRGDFFSVDFGAGGTQTTLHRISADVSADGAGLASGIPIQPNMPVGPAGPDPVRFIRPHMKAVVAPDSYSPGRKDRWMTTGMSLRLMQTLR